jgi:hypothetical protein
VSFCYRNGRTPTGIFDVYMLMFHALFLNCVSIRETITGNLMIFVLSIFREM